MKGGDKKNEGGRERALVITTKLGVTVSSHMLKG